MKFITLLSASALFMATLTAAVMPDDPNKIDTCVMPGVVAWTFDDGPGKFNDQLLAILKKHDVKATFYVLGQMIAQDPAQAASLKKMLDAGHQLASHTYSHSNMDLMTADQMKKEINDTSDLIFKHAGVRVNYMRAPEGRCAELCTKTMEGMGQIISHWNVDTNDWRFTSNTPEVATQKSMEEPNKVIIQDSNPATDSFILLQHEIHQFSVERLAEQVITAVKGKGYRFVTMEECIGKPAYAGGVVPPVSNTTSTATVPVPTSGAAPVPTSGTSKSSSSSPAGSGSAPQPTVGKTPESGASIKQMGAWAMGAAALASYLLL